MGKQPASGEEVVGLLLEAWSDALGVPVTPDSDFLALDGTSLAAVSIAQAVVASFGDHEDLELVALQALFEQATLQDMADELHKHIAGIETEHAG